MTKTENLALPADFPPATEADWRKLVDIALKGAPFDKRLVSRTYDGLRIEPLYPRRADVRPVAGRTGPWQVMQRIDLPDPAAANVEALHDLQNGATALSLTFAGAVGAYGFGLPADDAALARVFDDVYLDAGIGIELDLGSELDPAPEILARLVARRGHAPADTQIRFGMNPLAVMALRGGGKAKWSAIAPVFAKRVADLATAGYKGPFAAADGRVIHNAGGSEAQELAFALSSALAYLRALETHGVPLGDARRMIAFRLSADDDQFLTIAKFRALRKLWARVEQACGQSPGPVFVAAETAWRMMTQRDPNVNMLRETIAVVGAGLGGADAITVLPFTLALGLPDHLARRIARNTQLILLEESNLAKVSDPAAGSGGIEDLTDKLCGAAWTLFQEIEQAGGAAAELESGSIQQNVASTRAERESAIAHRKEPLTGTSDYPNLGEQVPPTLDVGPAPVPAHALAVIFAPLAARRLGEP